MSIQAGTFVCRRERHLSCCNMGVIMASRVFIVALLSFAVSVGLAPVTALADVWTCVQEDGSYLFTDRGDAYCRRIVEKDKDRDRAKEAPIGVVKEGPSPASAAPTAGNVQAPASVPAKPVKVPPAFRTVIHRVPVLMVNQLSAQQESQGFYMANRGEVALVDLAVSHVASGTGPEVSTDSHFGGNMDVSLRAAVSAAAKAVGYDPRFLRVRLSVKTSILQSGLYIDGPSAGAVLAVGVASALLGDQIRPEVCMSGTIDENLDVGPVGGLEEKIKGCRRFNYREMVVPSAQTSMDLALKGKGSDITITEVSTLDAAYQTATGQSLRIVTLP
ncbi:MAG: hypothetical protein EPO02_05940 [Nitrospirae bacterium]|nr:MAG: hypothetical protein EPO02_05940 [Nitrospirota bacterium]